MSDNCERCGGTHLLTEDVDGEWLCRACRVVKHGPVTAAHAVDVEPVEPVEPSEPTEWPEWMLVYADKRTALRKAHDAMDDVDALSDDGPTRWGAGVRAIAEHYAEGHGGDP